MSHLPILLQVCLGCARTKTHAGKTLHTLDMAPRRAVNEFVFVLVLAHNDADPPDGKPAVLDGYSFRCQAHPCDDVLIPKTPLTDPDIHLDDLSSDLQNLAVGLLSPGGGHH
jgi:hypothetical protein